MSYTINFLQGRDPEHVIEYGALDDKLAFFGAIFLDAVLKDYILYQGVILSTSLDQNTNVTDIPKLPRSAVHMWVINAKDVGIDLSSCDI